MRIGQGYDIHKLVEGRPLIIGGVNIPYEKGLLGHSDADVLIHAIIDALFGAINDGDIGEHFPDTDPKFKGADSIMFLEEAGKILKNKGYEILNIDSTVVCQKPKLSPYKKQMAENISNALKISSDIVSIKGKTKEEQDASGRGEAIEAIAIMLVKKTCL